MLPAWLTLRSLGSQILQCRCASNDAAAVIVCIAAMCASAPLQYILAPNKSLLQGLVFSGRLSKSCKQSLLVSRSTRILHSICING